MERYQLVSVLEVAEQQNITKAAKKLFISQPSLSNQLIRLEEELGVKLFERQRRRVFATDAGKIFVERARRILRQMDELKEAMEDHAKLRRGRLRLGILPLILPLRIAELLHDFQARCPALELSVEENGSWELTREVDGRELDAALVISERNIPEDGLNRLLLFRSRIMAVMSRGHPLSGEKSIAPEMLEGQKLIIYNTQFQLPKLILSLLDQRDVNYRISVNCSQLETCFALVEKGFGIAFALAENCDYYGNERLRCLPLEGIPERTVSLIYKKDPRYHPVLGAFIDFLRERYPRSPEGSPAKKRK